MAFASVLLGLLFLKAASGFQNCPLLGIDFPIPSSYSNNAAVQNAATAIKDAIDAGLQSGDLENSTASFSVEVFSLNDTLFSYHHSASNLSPDGVQTVDSDSIYRIGSISKLFTVYMLLIEAGDAHFNEPVTKYVPELANYIHNDDLDFVDWNSVTIGNLANGTLGELLQSAPEELLVEYGFPPLSLSEIPPCILGTTLCSRKEFLNGLKTQHPVFKSSKTPVYSNAAFQLLAYAIEGITGKSYESILEKDILTPLKLTHTTYFQPQNSTYGVIPINQTVSGWNADIGEAGPAGSFYSSATDLIAFGRSILSSKLLSPAQTRRWLKPVSHTSSFYTSVGAPWEIYRYSLPQTSRIVDLYTKDGSLGAYNSELVLVPEWNLGFIVLEAGIAAASGAIPLLVSNITSAVLFPTLDSAARDEAGARYPGTYMAKNGLNSSITISINGSKPGLGIDSWVSNGTDILSLISTVITTPFDASVRLYASGLEHSLPSGEKQIGWRALFEPIVTLGYSGPFTDPCSTWGGTNTLMYNEVGIDEFLFTLGDDGAVKSIQARAFGAVLEKV